MSKWPTTWEEAIAGSWIGHRASAERMLDALAAVGALKEPPVVHTEWWVAVDRQGDITKGVPQKPGDGWEDIGERVVHVREVVDE